MLRNPYFYGFFGAWAAAMLAVLVFGLQVIGFWWLAVWVLIFGSLSWATYAYARALDQINQVMRKLTDE